VTAAALMKCRLLLLIGRLPFLWHWLMAKYRSRRFLATPSPWLEFAQTNVALCFPRMALSERDALMRQVAFESALSAFNRLRGLACNADALRQMVRIDNLDVLQRCMARGPVVLVCPHFVGLELAGLRLSLETRLSVLYNPTGDSEADAILQHLRLRVHDADLFARNGFLRPAVGKLKSGQPLLIAPDLDFGPAGTVFAPFFDVAAATPKTTAWVAVRCAATVLPLSIRRVDCERHLLTIHEPIEGLSGDLTTDSARINATITSLIAAAPAHYWWDHPRFATRPPGERPAYSDAAMAFAVSHCGVTPSQSWP
jgi:Kdo2-lipid IVA lauroyltransferase/acyltransferase